MEVSSLTWYNNSSYCILFIIHFQYVLDVAEVKCWWYYCLREINRVNFVLEWKWSNVCVYSNALIWLGMCIW
jgi:hypothetical protein